MDFLTIAAFSFFGIGLCKQILLLRKVKKAEAISLWEVGLRNLANFFLLYKMYTTGDVSLIIGEVILVVTTLAYLGHVIYYKTR